MPVAKFLPEANDLIAANRAHYLASVRTTRMFRACLLGAATFSVIALLWAWDEGCTPPICALITLAGFMLWPMILGAILALNYFLLPSRARQMFVQQKTLHDEVEIEWSESGISFRSDRGISKFSWNDFVGIAENEDAIVLLQSDRLFNFIPKRCLPANQALEIIACYRRRRDA